MKEINKFLKKVFLIFLVFTSQAESKILSIGSPNAKITVKVFSSLTCPHCADFHENIFEDLKKEYIDKGLVKFNHYGFPLDLAALNAEIIVRCHLDNKKSFQLLGEIYEKQNKWAIGSDINVINESIKKIGNKTGLSNIDMDNCLNNETTQDQILNERIEAQKNYKIQSTPTIYVNEKLYNGKHNFKDFRKAIDKLL